MIITPFLNLQTNIEYVNIFSLYSELLANLSEAIPAAKINS